MNVRPTCGWFTLRHGATPPNAFGSSKCHCWKSYWSDRPAANCGVICRSSEPAAMPPAQRMLPPASRSVSNCAIPVSDALLTVVPGGNSCACASSDRQERIAASEVRRSMVSFRRGKSTIVVRRRGRVSIRRMAMASRAPQARNARADPSGARGLRRPRRPQRRMPTASTLSDAGCSGPRGAKRRLVPRRQARLARVACQRQTVPGQRPRGQRSPNAAIGRSAADFAGTLERSFCGGIRPSPTPLKSHLEYCSKYLFIQEKDNCCRNGAKSLFKNRKTVDRRQAPAYSSPEW